MNMTHILRADLNLIPALVALLDERHISRAAERIGLSQPAMSRALQRLRSALGDPLLIRGPDGYGLTARAQALQVQLDTLVPLLEALTSPQSFDPGTSSQPIRLACTDFAVLAWGRAISHTFLAAAPSTAVRFHSWRYDTMAEHIQRAGVDVGLYGGYSQPDMSTEELTTETFVCVLAADHPLAGRPHITLGDYGDFGHIVVDVADGVQPDIDYRLKKLGAPRKAIITVPYHAVIPELLADTDLIATVPAPLASTWAAAEAVTVTGAPTEIGTMPYRMIWHPAFDDDSRHRWIRSVLRATITAVGAEPRQYPTG